MSKIYVILVEYCMKLTLLSASKRSNYYKHVEKTYNFRIKLETGKLAIDWRWSLVHCTCPTKRKSCAASPLVTLKFSLWPSWVESVVIWLPCAVIRWECTSASLVSVLSCWSGGANLQRHCLSSLTGGVPCFPVDPVVPAFNVIVFPHWLAVYCPWC